MSLPPRRRGSTGGSGFPQRGTPNELPPPKAYLLGGKPSGKGSEKSRNPCKFFRFGRCLKGDQCEWEHATQHPQSAAPAADPRHPHHHRDNPPPNRTTAYPTPPPFPPAYWLPPTVVPTKSPRSRSPAPSSSTRAEMHRGYALGAKPTPAEMRARIAQYAEASRPASPGVANRSPSNIDSRPRRFEPKPANPRPRQLPLPTEATTPNPRKPPPFNFCWKAPKAYPSRQRSRRQARSCRQLHRCPSPPSSPPRERKHLDRGQPSTSQCGAAPAAAPYHPRFKRHAPLTRRGPR